jgi:hypothetical protein
VPALQAAIDAGPSAESGRRLRELLEQAARPSSERVLQRRAVAALEYARTAETTRVLDLLATGVKDDPLTQDAAAARARLNRQSK